VTGSTPAKHAPRDSCGLLSGCSRRASRDLPAVQNRRTRARRPAPSTTVSTACFKQAYFAFGTGQAAPALGEILPYLKQLAAGHAAD
jgi:hypothetical protein